MKKLNGLYILMGVYLLLIGLGIGAKVFAISIASLAMISLILYADRVFKRQDTEWNKVQRARQSLTMAAESALGLYECEAGGDYAFNPSSWMQVAD